MTEQHVSIWDDPDAQSGNQQPSETASITTDTTTTTTAQNPLAGAIEASAWEREDIELAASVAQVLLMAYFVAMYRQEAGSR